MQIRPTAFTIGLIIYSFIALFFVYTEFGIDSFKMISSITIGPKNRMSIEDVKYFLIANGLDTSKINIMKSESTYQ